MYKHELTVIVNSIIASISNDEQIHWAKELSLFYQRILEGKHLSDNEVIVKGGVALSSSSAADCVDDYLRTTNFIKGVFKALNSLDVLFPERNINILYAGCGPYATLILPLLPLFNKERIKAVLIDINKTSIESVQQIISIIGLESYNLRLIEADATTYIIPKDFEVDLAVSETMHYALTREPQVAISRNIIKQLPQHGIFIPQEIKIDLVYTFFDYEPSLKVDINGIKGYKNMQPYIYNVFVDRLLTINKEHFVGDNLVSKIETDYYSLPIEFSNFPDICLFTEIKIFEDIELKTAESYITNPYCIVSMYSIKDYPQIQFIYDFSEMPKWTYKFKK
ncbi:MAG: hypothetical protein J7574_09025 [Flavobacterium sp.]|uniref:hypothetical protein n=1 Tax=Flavobacterium sp. TaxID=239 RepID=UPI001B15DE8C|nr:hypothetical protein [Flavobacterium sp.]MBO9584288.1 hypothetical protein [Flavobacterium sp.]